MIIETKELNERKGFPKDELAGARSWYAAAVRSRHEFVARDELVSKGIETFLPWFTKVRQWSDRKKQVTFPVFPGYLFVRVAPQPGDFLQVVKTRGMVGLVCLEPGYPTAVPEHEVEALKCVVFSGQPFDVYPGYQIGARVRVRRGPLEGAEGVLARKEDSRFFVNVELLGRSVGVRINADDLEVI